MVYLHSVPVMKAVIFADIILEPRNSVIYYSPLIKTVISLSIPLPLTSPSETFSSSSCPSPPFLLYTSFANFQHVPFPKSFGVTFFFLPLFSCLSHSLSPFYHPHHHIHFPHISVLLSFFLLCLFLTNWF